MAGKCIVAGVPSLGSATLALLIAKIVVVASPSRPRLTGWGAGDYVGGAMKAVVLLLIGFLALLDRASATTLLDYVTFDGIDYIRWTTEEPGRALTRDDLGPEFAIVECSFGEDTKSCSYGVDASAAFLPSGTRVYAVRGYPT